MIDLGAHTHTHRDFRGRPDVFAEDLAENCSTTKAVLAVVPKSHAAPVKGWWVALAIMVPLLFFESQIKAAISPALSSEKAPSFRVFKSRRMLESLTCQSSPSTLPARMKSGQHYSNEM